MTTRPPRPRADDGLSAHLLRQQPGNTNATPPPAASCIVQLKADNDTSALPGDEGSSGIPWLPVAGFVVLTFNSVMALYRSQGDTAALAFVAFSYVDLVLLFYCLRRYERAAAGSPQREWLKAAVWLLTAALTVVFSYKVAAIMPLPVAVLVWAMAFATVGGGFYAFFLHSEK